ncbi:AGE family epimerase/isomerase [Celeribacter halophilus]|uniref:AGE family epimerase/isomerase n=1 Tax=Celeribacter halophilus TaxID=576117 RepID=A0AAW7XTP2_9RHOB|nr:AGE family epimerase/isomerase [Celeribacter halophilus]MDO6457664.1 AGE family epimerase/isomerase [Celeribacter halophilus]MDO6723922.1 AGE family epimerase/isomerase [Celeribacter halophilus]
MRWQEWAENWLYNISADLWRGTGLDPKSGLSWEALSVHGEPLPNLQRRIRVQFRQSYCFARLARQKNDPTLLTAAYDLFQTALMRGVCAQTGHLVATLNPDLSTAHVKHDLYDLAFVLLAVSALIDAGRDMSAELTWVERQLASLKADNGWHEAADHPLPRRQNPHMHLFEAATEIYRVTQVPRFLKMAQECLSLFRTHVLTSEGDVLEFFAADWTPCRDDAQQIEPGHGAEWIYLLDHYETVTGQPHGVDLEKMFLRAAATCDQRGFLPDTCVPMSDTRRLWPQTELLKAALVLSRKGYALPEAFTPDDILARFIVDYLSPPMKGGWYDTLRMQTGEVVSNHMPASSYYHIVVALETYLRPSDVSWEVVGPSLPQQKAKAASGPLNLR